MHGMYTFHRIPVEIFRCQGISAASREFAPLLRNEQTWENRHRSGVHVGGSVEKRTVVLLLLEKIFAMRWDRHAEIAATLSFSFENQGNTYLKSSG